MKRINISEKEKAEAIYLISSIFKISKEEVESKVARFKNDLKVIKNFILAKSDWPTIAEDDFIYEHSYELWHELYMSGNLKRKPFTLKAKELELINIA